MSERFVNIDRETPMLFPVDMRDWLPEDHLVHFVIEAIEQIGVAGFKVNRRGSGSEQYPPEMILALLVYSYVTGRFGSRAIEAATYTDVALRYICGGEVEPVFGIIKSIMGFRQFMLRGIEKVNTEWVLVRVAYNFKRLHRLMGGKRLTECLA